MPYKVEKTVALGATVETAVPYEGAEVCITSVNKQQNSETDYLLYVGGTGSGNAATNLGSVGGSIIGNANWVVTGSSVQYTTTNASGNSSDGAFKIGGALTMLVRFRCDSGDFGWILKQQGSEGDEGSAANALYGLAIHPDTNGISYFNEYGNGTDEFRYTVVPEINVGTTYDIAITRSATGELKYYLDGALLETQTITMPTGGENSVFYLGDNKAQVQPGELFGCVVTDRVLDLEEINDVFTSFTGDFPEKGYLSLGRATTDANGVFNINVGEYSGEVKADVYIDGIKPQVKRFIPIESGLNPNNYLVFYNKQYNGNPQQAPFQGNANQLTGWATTDFTTAEATGFSDLGYNNTSTATYAGIANSADSQLINSQLTGEISIYIRLKQTYNQTNTRGILAIRNSSNNASGYQILVNNSGNIVEFSQKGNGATEILYSNSSINETLGSVVDLVITKSATGVVNMYLDGVNVGTANFTASIPVWSGVFQISRGYQYDSGSGWGSYRAEYQAVIVDSREWTSEEIAQINAELI